MSEPSSLVLVITTVAESDDARQLAKSLIEQSLAACVQVEAPITSYYHWQAELQEDREYRLMIKSTAAAWPQLLKTLSEIHPYDEPEIIRLDVVAASEGYERWAREQTAQN